MKEIAQLDVTDNKRLILATGEYRGEERIDLRQFVKVGDKYIPTPKGINFSLEWIDKFRDMMKKLDDI